MTIPDGIYPTMVTPFTYDNKINYAVLEGMVEWYIDNGVHGLFAVCQSSEMFFLTLQERVHLAHTIVELARGRIAVIASGHISDSIEEQIEEIKAISAVGPDAFVMVANRLAGEDEDEDFFKRNLDKLLNAIPEIPLGFYECPYPYHRLFSTALLRHVAETGRFEFLKDTCCDLDRITARIQAVAHTPLKIYNANTVFLLASLRAGCAGFSGIMGNYHPRLYRWLFDHQNDPRAEEMQWMLSMMGQCLQYPRSAKYYLSLEGIPISEHSRSNPALLNPEAKGWTEQLQLLTRRLEQEFGIR
ncbi:MAG: dihydrodipicolinate synthase family protein [Anaerolineae bacterium]|jgi:4-hydroxy-tetrahydrodipicolinate synthase|nr:dihydrodipicolinate synthase family protein [Anaerolineae bacterium]